jgi:hypothetical protein
MKTRLPYHRANIEDPALAHYGFQPAKYIINDYAPEMKNHTGSVIRTNVPLPRK